MKKRNLYIGIVLIIIVFVSLYVSNNKTVFEGVASKPTTAIPTTKAPTKAVLTTARPTTTTKAPAPTTTARPTTTATATPTTARPGTTSPPIMTSVTYNKIDYKINQDMYTALKNIEQILNGKKRIGADKNDYIEYLADLKNSNCYDTGGSAAISNPEQNFDLESIKTELKNITLSFNDVAQVIYFYMKTFYSTTATDAEKFKKLKPYLFIYVSFISKIKSNTEYILNNDDGNSNGKKLLLILFNTYPFILKDEMPDYDRKKNSYTKKFIDIFNYIHLCLGLLYSSYAGRGDLNGQFWFLCNFSNKPIPLTNNPIESATSILKKTFLLFETKYIPTLNTYKSIVMKPNEGYSFDEYEPPFYRLISNTKERNAEQPLFSNYAYGDTAFANALANLKKWRGGPNETIPSWYSAQPTIPEIFNA
jgi:hypothetical protein